MPQNKLFLLDAYALIFRAYYAFISNPMTNSKGMPTSTVFGFTLALEELLKKENPSHIAVVFDPPGPTFRHEMYEAYKANRDATPEDIKTAVPYIKKLLEGFRIPVVEVAGYEADDVIGTLAKQAEKDGFEVYMMTPDKDFAQLVSKDIFMYKPGRKGGDPEVLGPPEVREKFAIEKPEQVIDILALMGDSADNIPGAKGIGPKSAGKLVSEYGNIEGVYEHLEELKGKQKENLENSKEDVFLSKILATIALDVPLSVRGADFVRKEIDTTRLGSVFSELEFNTLARRILGTAGQNPQPPVMQKSSISPPASTDGQGSLFGTEMQEELELKDSSMENIDTVEHEYILVNTIDGVRDLAGKLSSLDSFCFDSETTGLDPIEAELVGLSFSWKAHKAYYIAFGRNSAEISSWLEPLRGPFSSPDIEKTGQNLKYDLHILKNYDIEVKGVLFDTMLAHFLLKPENKHNLNVMAEQYLGYSMVKIESLIGNKGAGQGSFRNVPVEKAREYAGEDADITWQLSLLLKKELKEEGLENLARQIEMPLVPVLMEMEHQGVKFDTEPLNSFATELKEDILKLEENIHELAGMQFNIASPKQLGIVLFEHLKVTDKAKKTSKSKQYATGEEVLLSLKDKHPIVEKVLEYRSLTKLLNTYVLALPRLVKPHNQKLHTSYNQALVATGRLSSNNPNLQQIPIREERGREIRKAFIPGEGNVFLSADYSQIELRLMAHLSGDSNMIDAFVAEEDIHTATAAKIYKLEPGEVSKEMRSKAKTANFGIIYGISAFGLAQRMQISRTEARELIDGYFESYPGVRKYMDNAIAMAREKGYVETMYERRRHLPDILSRNAIVRGNAERNAINSPLQGSAADIIKIAMIRIQKAIEKHKLESSMILQVHDELNFDVLPNELDEVKKIVREGMEGAANLSVPLTIDMGEGKNWLEAH